MRTAAILLAAGRGDRLGAAVPKALVALGGRPLLQIALERIEAAGLEAVVVASAPGETRIEEVARAFPTVREVVEGGSTRQGSVRAALAVLPEDVDVVVCHDAARPLASPHLFASVIAALEPADGAIPVVPVADTVKRLDGETVVETVPRDDLGLAQTPQAFRREALERAHATALEQGWEGTDDASLVERAGFKVVTVAGDPANLKITTATDLRIASELFRG